MNFPTSQHSALRTPHLASHRLGLLGGSFNPAHRAHRRITQFAMAALGLDETWWLVSPGNPLKPAQGMAPLAARVRSARFMARRAPIRVTAIERIWPSVYTVDTLRALRRRWPKRRFVWLMGADNLVQFHRWQDWEGIMRMVPVAVLGRPGSVVRGQMSRAARIYAAERVPPGAAGDLGRMQPPVWAFADIPLSDLSSSAIRARGEWGG